MTTPRLLALLPAFLAVPGADAASWEFVTKSLATFELPAGITIAETSGVTYVGPVAGSPGVHRFLTADENHGHLLRMDLLLNTDGTIGNAGGVVTGVSTVPIGSTHDFEGIAYTSAARNSVFLSDETGPNVAEYSLATGTLMQSVAIPSLFAANMRSNRGFESLTRSRDGTVMWTANQEALTVDGPRSTTSVGSIVRLLELEPAGTNYTAGAQFAYQVDPIQSPSNSSADSGLSDLTLMPDGTLLALERAFSSAAFPNVFRNRIYEVNFAGATDISVGPPATGLSGKSYTPVAKSLIWSGIVDSLAGQNLEGLTLGPQLANGDWVLVGVVDDDSSDPLSTNAVATFVLRAIPSADFNQNGQIDAGDYTVWRDNLGRAIGATTAHGDGDRDGDVDMADLTIWRNSFSAAPAGVAQVPEPNAVVLLVLVIGVLPRAGKRQFPE